MNFVKNLALGGVIAITAATALVAQDAPVEPVEPVDPAAPSLFGPDGALGATNFAVVAPIAGGALLFLGLIAGGGGTSGTPDTQ